MDDINAIENLSLESDLSYFEAKIENKILYIESLKNAAEQGMDPIKFANSIIENFNDLLESFIMCKNRLKMKVKPLLCAALPQPINTSSRISLLADSSTSDVVTIPSHDISLSSAAAQITSDAPTFPSPQDHGASTSHAQDSDASISAAAQKVYDTSTPPPEDFDASIAVPQASASAAQKVSDVQSSSPAAKFPVATFSRGPLDAPALALREAENQCSIVIMNLAEPDASEDGERRQSDLDDVVTILNSVNLAWYIKNLMRYTPTQLPPGRPAFLKVCFASGEVKKNVLETLMANISRVRSLEAKFAQISFSDPDKTPKVIDNNVSRSSSPFFSSGIGQRHSSHAPVTSSTNCADLQATSYGTTLSAKPKITFIPLSEVQSSSTVNSVNGNLDQADEQATTFGPGNSKQVKFSPSVQVNRYP